MEEFYEESCNPTRSDAQHFWCCEELDSVAPAQADQVAARVPLENYIQGHATGNADSRRIEAVEITGNAGSAKIVLDYPTVTYTDYMSLLKVGDEWKIVNKVFYAESKPKP